LFSSRLGFTTQDSLEEFIRALQKRGIRNLQDFDRILHKLEASNLVSDGRKEKIAVLQRHVQWIEGLIDELQKENAALRERLARAQQTRYNTLANLEDLVGILRRIPAEETQD
jgi:Rad3-related DNA helicase